jgi:Holliday junction resolvase RusA-like endonuclease
MDTYHFDIAPPETTHQAALQILKNKQTGKMFVGKMKKSDAKKWEAQFHLLLKTKKPKEPLFKDKPIRVIVALFYQPPKCRPCKNIEWKTTKPDADNVVKTILDSLVTCGYIEADQKIADLRVMKLEWDKGGFTEVMIGEATPFIPTDPR